MLVKQLLTRIKEDQLFYVTDIFGYQYTCTKEGIPPYMPNEEVKQVDIYEGLVNIIL